MFHFPCRLAYWVVFAVFSIIECFSDTCVDWLFLVLIYSVMLHAQMHRKLCCAHARIC